LAMDLVQRCGVKAAFTALTPGFEMGECAMQLRMYLADPACGCADGCAQQVECVGESGMDVRAAQRIAKFAAGILDRDQIAKEVSAVDRRDVAGLERVEIARVVPVEQMPPVPLQAPDRGERRFEAVEHLRGSDPAEVIGRDGVEIHDFWKGDARAYNGVTVPGFPNFFLIYGPNVGGVVAGSLHFMIERAVEFSLKAVHEVLQRGASAIDVKPAALDRFVEWVDAGNRRLAWGQPYVRSWYQNSHGRVSQVWPYTNVEYWEATETVKADDHEFLA